MSARIRRLGVCTGGGDAPGLNACIRAVVLAALQRGIEVVGIAKSYVGLLDPPQTRPLDREAVRGITHRGGTILGTTNRGNPFAYPVRRGDGSEILTDCSAAIARNFGALGLDALIAIGGDGTMRIAHELAAVGIPVVGVPKTIDNDLASTIITFGFDTAVSVATEALDRLHSTAEAHERVFVVEVMGRHAGWIALHAGVAGSADAILIPEIPFDIAHVCAKVRERERIGRPFAIVVAAEGAAPLGSAAVVQEPGHLGGEARLGGIGEVVARQIAAGTAKETRCVVLGHLQRGGPPTTFDRLLALRCGTAAVRFAARGLFDTMVALVPPEVRAVPLAEAIAARKHVPVDCDTVLTARELGVSLGDRAPPEVCSPP